jgi:hypothetical protein
MSFAGLAAMIAAVSAEPVGPGGWSFRNGLGCLLYLGLFVVALRGIAKLGTDGAEEPQEDR